MNTQGAVLLKFSVESTGEWVLNQFIKFTTWEELDSKIEKLFGSSLENIKEVNSKTTIYNISGIEIFAALGHKDSYMPADDLDEKHIKKILFS